jgi:hypothetical protein
VKLGGAPTEAMTMRQAQSLTTQLQRKNKKAVKTLRDLASQGRA